MTDDLDALLDANPAAPETAVTVVSSDRKCRRHRWLSDADPGAANICDRCGIWRDYEASRRGKSARRRGNDYEREVATALGGVKVGMYGGPVDVQTPLLAVQVKVRTAFPSWMSDELAKLPRTGGRVPTLVVADTPGAGRRRRALVVMSLEDFRSLHGSET